MFACRCSNFGSISHVLPYRCVSIRGTMAEDAGLFNNKSRDGESELPYAKKTKTDLYVSPGNCLSRKMVDPYGENELDAITPANLWQKASTGDE